ncbi:hypothetical protein [Polyangium sp. y55x31]|uniref:hypothetical protein n=1 Tax=Polyangium sp. y55x31 TaxID=3042688 RepID=UPI0024831218|nr:hypothetical protein [Polyangium sp. y55x31]MDI1478569.1 hypothetical protein [Polyangium sp. y55x31]
MRRHGAALIVIIAVAFLSLGSGSRADDWHEPSPESCKTELGFVFDWCGSRAHWPCNYVEEGVFDACQAGCVMYFCPEQITCTELDPMWCGTPCEDPSGARFWRDLVVARERCDPLFWPDNDESEWEGDSVYHWRDCQDAVRKERCPAHRTWRERYAQWAKENNQDPVFPVPPLSTQ